MPELSVESLLAEAETSTGLDDFGDNAFREGLEQAVAGFAGVPLTPTGRDRRAEFKDYVDRFGL